MTKKSRRSDLLTTNHGTIISLRPLTAKARQWMFAHVPDSHASLARAVDCEHRCAIDIIEGAIAAGLVCEDSTSGRKAVR